MPEVQRADPTTRRRALVATVLIALIGWAAYVGLQDWLGGIREFDPARQRVALEKALVWATWAALLPVALYAVWMWRYGTRVRRAARFPAPGARVIRDTPVLHGPPARLRGTVLRLLAAALGLLTAGTLVVVYRLVALLPA